MSDLKNSLERHMKNPEFKREFEGTEEEYQLIRNLIAARIQANLTQKELAEKSGIRQSNISRIENGSCVPTLETLWALAAGLGMELRLEFVPAKQTGGRQL